MAYHKMDILEHLNNEEEDKLYEWVSKKSLKKQVTILLAALKEALFQQEGSAVKVNFVKKAFAEQVQKAKNQTVRNEKLTEDLGNLREEHVKVISKAETDKINLASTSQKQMDQLKTKL